MADPLKISGNSCDNIAATKQVSTSSGLSRRMEARFSLYEMDPPHFSLL